MNYLLCIYRHAASSIGFQGNKPTGNKLLPDLFLALILIISATLSGCSTVKSAKLLAPESFGMEPTAEKVYVESGMEQSRREELINALDMARQRIFLYYGNALSTPEFIACATEACFQALGGATARAKAFGKSKILLSPRGQTVPVIAHEWSHTELHARVGNFFSMRNIPQWFDEGLAVVVSNEPTHSETAWQELQDKGIPCPILSELQSNKEWLDSAEKYGEASFNEEKYNVAYSCVGHEVRRWYRRAGRSGLAHLIEAVRFNKPFEGVYKEVEGGFNTEKR